MAGRWTQERDRELLIRANAGEPLAQIARSVNRTVQALNVRLDFLRKRKEEGEGLGCMDDTLNAIARLAAFRARWNKSDVVCSEAGLTATDLDLILAQLRLKPIEWAEGDPVMRELRVGNE